MVSIVITDQVQEKGFTLVILCIGETGTLQNLHELHQFLLELLFLTFKIVRYIRLVSLELGLFYEVLKQLNRLAWLTDYLLECHCNEISFDL